MAEPSETRIDLRTDHYSKRVIARAAELTGTNVTQFIMERVYPEAEKIVAKADQHRVVLDEAGWETFCRRLDEAPRNPINLSRLLGSPSQFSDE